MKQKILNGQFFLAFISNYNHRVLHPKKIVIFFIRVAFFFLLPMEYWSCHDVSSCHPLILPASKKKKKYIFYTISFFYWAQVRNSRVYLVKNIIFHFDFLIISSHCMSIQKKWTQSDLFLVGKSTRKQTFPSRMPITFILSTVKIQWQTSGLRKQLFMVNTFWLMVLPRITQWPFW